MKREWVKKGYSKMFSLYGALWNKETDSGKGVRIEILSNVEIDEETINVIYAFFYKYTPSSNYTLWLFDGVNHRISMVSEYKW